MRPHEELNGKTPVESCGIRINGVFKEKITDFQDVASQVLWMLSIH
jgi:hypothetical protein